MKRAWGLCAVLLLCSTLTIASTVREHVDNLAADAMEGRMTGSPGAEKSVAYIEQQLEALGAQPLPGSDNLRETFEFTAGAADAGTVLRLLAGAADVQVIDSREHVQALSFSDARAVQGDVVFAGYGLKLPDDSEFPYDSYAAIDVKDKVALVMRYFPEEVDRDTRALLARYSGLRYKAMQAREAGAKALILVTGPNSPNAGEVVPMRFDTALAGSGIVAVSIDLATAEQFLVASGKGTLAELQTSMDTANPHVIGFPLEAVRVELDVKIERKRRTGLNVLGYLPPTVASAASGSIALGAHYDHLGHGEGGNSLADASEKGDIHNGADDNASGVAAVLSAAAQLAQGERSHGIILGFWGGEELGLLGSSAFVDRLEEVQPPVGVYLNFDMVGRLNDEKLTVQGVGSSDSWLGLLEQANVVHGFDLYTQNDPYLPTDSQAFYLEEVPSINFFTGSHEDYHRPSDDAEKIEIEGIERIAHMAVTLVNKLDKMQQLPSYQKVERSREGSGDRDSMRAYTGTIPDYTTEVEGLLLSGVVGGGPAEEAGLQKGDIIVVFAGQSITNIYDYTYALDAVKIDVAVQVTIVRDAERLTMTMTPRARK